MRTHFFFMSKMRTRCLKTIFQQAPISAKTSRCYRNTRLKPKAFQTTILSLLISVIAQTLCFPTKPPPTSQNTHMKWQNESNYPLYLFYRYQTNKKNHTVKSNIGTVFLTVTNIYTSIPDKQVITEFFQGKVTFNTIYKLWCQ